MIVKKSLFFYLKIFLVILFVWVIQTLFLNQAARTGLNGWDDWGMLFYYDAYQGYDLRNFPTIARETGTPYIWTEIYNIGPLKQIFGLQQTSFKLLQLFFKSLAALSVGYLVFRFCKDKLFASFAVFFFIIFPSTAGVLSHIIFIGGYLTVVFICFAVLFYSQSSREPKKILLASLFFFLALLACPPRAYFILPVPFIVELVRLKRSHRLLSFFKRLAIFYLPLIFLQSRPGIFIPHLEMLARFKQVMSGNLYSLSFPFQAVSALFIDKSILNEVIKDPGTPYPSLAGLIIVNLIIVVLSVVLGLVIKGKKSLSFILLVIFLTLILEGVFLFFGFLSANQGVITYINYSVGSTYSQTLSSSIYQASLGSFYFILGLFLSFEWWFKQRGNKVLLVISAAWLWSIVSEIILYLTNHWYTMVDQSYDRYIIVSSIGAVIFLAGIFSLYFQALTRLKNFNLKIGLFFLAVFFLILTSWKDFKLMDRFYLNWNEEQGGSSYWQETMYNRFINKIGSDNLNNSMLLYIDHNESNAFNEGSFIYPARFRLLYKQDGKLIRGNCKAVVGDIKVLKNAYIIQNAVKGYLVDSICVDPAKTFAYRQAFYPLSNFFAYRIENKDFINIKEEVLDSLNKPQ